MRIVTKKLALIASGVFIFIGLETPVQAQGLLDMLFGPQPQPVYYHRYAPSGGMRLGPPRHSGAVARAARKAAQTAAWRQTRKKNAARAVKIASLGKVLTAAPSNSQKTTCCRDGEDLVQAVRNDPTLRPGDAFMTEHGLKIYSGKSPSSKSAPDFVDFRAVRLGPSARARFESLEQAAKSHPGMALTRRDDETSEDRSAPPAKQRMVMGPSGRKIRAIGPYRAYYGNKPAKTLRLHKTL